MKKVKKIIASVLLGTCMLSIAGCNLIEKTPERVQKSTVAKVKGEKITRGEVDEYPQMVKAIESAKAKYGNDYEKNEEAKSQLKETRKSVLDELTMEMVIMQKAKELKVYDEKKIEEEVNKQFDAIKKNYKDDKEFKKEMTAGGFTEKTLKNFLRIRVVVPKVYEAAMKDVKATEKETKEYYDSHMVEFTEKPNRIHVAHILVKTEEEAKKAKERLDKKEDFAKVAKEVSTDKAANEQGGDLGFINYNDANYDKTFMTAAQALSKGQISSPIKTQFGWHIIKCIEKEEYPIKKYDQVKSEINKMVSESKKQSQWKEILEKWKNDAKIKLYEKNL
ncbi:peptidylprolyl isomerase [Haloimpatiens lingqiaonensis]|uniref:peptidylprolyl isomerase n=1 Tax=Haloimpatiens lingqiaonensis TaxID=1380675 RepID=UPI0010FE6993|nr:peptidylprolyl isomerase [Haloimpatiens lingqiaonensis]